MKNSFAQGLQTCKTVYLFILGFFFFFCCTQPGIEPVSSAVKAISSKHWTTREFSYCVLKKKKNPVN